MRSAECGIAVPGDQDAAELVRTATAAIRERLGDQQPKVAIVLGSGLGSLTENINSAFRIPHSALPGFPRSTVPGHEGQLVAGTLAGVPVLAQSGRFHLYEGHPAEIVALPVRVYAQLGIETLIVTNAAGALRPTFRAGSLMLIADHINLMWRSPLAGPVLPGEERFPDMSAPYDPALRAVAREVAREARIPLEEGVYCALLGPSYETPAEIAMLRRLGADAVGMSTVPEVIVARARGMRCLGISTITNAAAGTGGEPLCHDDVLSVGRAVASQLATVITGVVTRL